MSAGATLLKLQQIDLELARNKSELANMPTSLSPIRRRSTARPARRQSSPSSRRA